ncbi:MAG TPA: hypothetical protein VF006_31605 [Longimicrobium sp.]
MRKLKLELDSLVVQSFETTTPEGPARGTVHGRAEAGPDTPYCGTVDVNCKYTEQYSCEGTCEDTCAESCYGSCHSCIASCSPSCYLTCGASCPNTCPWCIAPTTDPPHS